MNNATGLLSNLDESSLHAETRLFVAMLRVLMLIVLSAECGDGAVV